VAEKPFGLFRQIFAGCYVHNLFADCEQIPHLQPEKYFPSGTRPDRKFIQTLFSAYAENSARLFTVCITHCPAAMGDFLQI